MTVPTPSTPRGPVRADATRNLIRAIGSACKLEPIMEVNPRLREVEIRTISTNLTVAVVHFVVELEHGVAGNRGNSMDINFEVDADHGLDIAVEDAKIQLQTFGEALAEAAKK